MATILGLAMKISADATGVQQSLTPVERALAKLDDQAKTITSSFDRFAGSSSAAAAAQAKAAADLERLTKQLQEGTITAPEYAKAFEELGNAVDAEVAAFERAGRTIEANRTPLERYDAEVRVLSQDLEAGRIDQETFDRAVAKATGTFTKAEAAAQGYSDAIEGAGKGNLQFNELSGILSALPGPLGNVAGRLSGLSSAGEGLARVFSGGLSGGLSAIGTSVAGLVNPFTAAAAGVAAFGAAAIAVSRGLTTLEDRVENLGNIADKLGVSFGFIQTLEEAANRSGTSIDSVSAAFGRLQKSVLGVDEESKAAQKALAELGVTAEEIQQLSPEEQYQRIGEALAGIEDPARRTATATALFGRAGADLIPFFNNLPGATADIERFGRALSQIDRERIDSFGAGLDALKVATQGLGQSLLLPFVGLGDGISTAFAEITAGLTAVIDPIGQVLEPVLTQIGRVAEVIGIGIGTIGRNVGAVFQPFATIAQTVSRALEPLNESIVSIARYLGDASTAVTRWLVSFSPIGAIAENAAALGDTLSRIVTIVTTAFSRIGELIGNTLGRAATVVGETISQFSEFIGLSGALETIGSVIGRVFGSISSVFSTIANAIGGTVGRLLTIAENFLGIERSAEGASAGVEQVTQSTQQLTAEQQKGYAEVQKAIAGSGQALDNAIAKAGEFGQAGFNAALEFQNALADLKEQADNNELNAEQYSRGVALATAEFDKQVESLRKVQEETRKAAEEAQRRVDADRQVSDALLEQARIAREFGGDNTRAKAAEDALAVEREIARVREEVAAARDGGDAEAVTNGETRIAQLEKIRNEQQAIADGSAKAAADEAQRLADQEQRVNALLNAGREQTQLEQQIADVQGVQARTAQELAAARLAGNEEAANTAAARLAQLDQLQASLEESQQAAEQGFGDGFAQAFQAVDQKIGEVINKAAEFGNAGAEAAQRLQEGIARAQEQARAGILNKEAFDAEVARQQEVFNKEVANLEKTDQLRKQKIQENARLREQAEAQAVKQAEEAVKQQQQLIQQQQAEYAKQQQAIAQEQARFAEERRKAEEAEFNRQSERIRELNTLGSRTVQTADIRTQEGQDLVLGLAANAQDPALIEARLQTKQLQLIAQGISQAASNYFNTPVAIVGGARLGGFG